MSQSPKKLEAREKRVAVKLTATLSLKDRPKERIEVEIHNLSAGGAFIQCLTPLQLGSEIQLQIHFTDSTHVRAKVIELPAHETIDETIKQNSVVRWSNQTSRPGFGIEFLNNNAENQEWISKVMDYFDKLSKAGVNL